MGRAHIVALLAATYLVWMFVGYRVRLWRKRSAGPPLRLLRRFDYRAVLDELGPPYREGLPVLPAAPPGHPLAEAAPAFLRESPWESGTPASHVAMRESLLRGETPAIDPGDKTSVSLALHCFMHRLLGGDLEGALVVASILPPELSSCASALAGLARAERAEAVRDAHGARRAAQSALRQAERALALAPSSPVRHYLVAHLRLAFFTHALNLEWAVARAASLLRGGLRCAMETPCLYFGLAHAAALLGRENEAVDELGRALYYARGDAFYSKVLAEDGYLASVRPALVATRRL
jgi:hypothetical protein